MSDKPFNTEVASCLYGGAALHHILSSPSRLRSFYKKFSPKDGGKLSQQDKRTIKSNLAASADALINAAQQIEALANQEVSNEKK
jgi:hypothetical protein